MKKFISFTVFLFLLSSSLLAQRSSGSIIDNNEDKYKGIVYNKEITVDTRLLTHGFAVGVNFAKIKTYYKSTYYQFELGELKNQKEFRQNSDNQILNQGSPQSFILGKQNNLFVLRAGYGVKRYYSEKAKRKGVAIGLNYEGGVTLGLLKPYYLDIQQNDVGQPDIVPTRPERFDPLNPCSFLDPLSGIYGSSGFFKGLGEIKPLPGIHGKVGVHFDWGAFDEFVKAIEVGVSADVFIRRAPIMIHLDEDILERMSTACPHLSNLEVQPNPNRPFFVNFYVTLHLGKRY